MTELAVSTSPTLPERMPPEAVQLKFDQATLAPRVLKQHSFDSTHKPEPTILHCFSCDYKTNGSLKTHLKHHIKKYSQQCHLCSYSARKKELVYHLKNHHSNRSPISKPHKDKQADRESTSKARKYYHCSQCGYKNTDRSDLNWHVRKKHPIAVKTSSTPSRKDTILRNDSACRKASFRLHQCDLCEYETNKKSNLMKHRQLHFKKSAYQCNRCSYSTRTSQHLNYHLENHHSELDQAGSVFSPQSKHEDRHHGNEETSAQEEELENLTSSLNCYECNFSTDSVAKMFHESCHSSINCTHKCHLCSCSSSLRNVTFHVANHHGDEATCLSSKSDKVITSVTSAEVNLVPVNPPIKSRNFDAEEKSCREEIALLEEVLQTDRESLENTSIKLMEREEQIKSMRIRVELVNENEGKTTEKRLKDVQLKKNGNEKQKREVEKKRMKTEFDLRTEQCKALELDLIAFDAVEEEPHENKVATEKIVQSLENQLGEILKELADLEEEGKTLSEDLREAEACYLAGFQSLSTHQAELEALESGWNADANSLNQMVDLLKEKLEVYYQLEEQLLDIELGEKMEHLSQKKMNCLLSLKNLCDG